ncbi:MAG: lysophospholipid acyltransferase family protein [Pseudomonadota bacterium]
MSLGKAIKDRILPPEMAEQLASIPRAPGEFKRDPWGMDKERSWLSFAVCKRLYDDYFRVQANGLENVPTKGRLLVIANHSGQLPMDGLLIGMALSTNPHGARAPRAMIERFFPTVPFVGNALNHMGAVIGDPVNCSRMLEHEACIVVFPEGIRGSGKPYADRYQLQRFGTGFMHLALKHNTPILPVGVVGCEETMPSAGNIKPLAKLLGIPYFPLAFPLPLPARVTLNFGKPLTFEGSVDSEDEVVAHVETVKSHINALIEDGLNDRTSVY